LVQKRKEEKEMSRNLTEKQQKFLDVLFEEAEGDPVQAVKLAGYAEGTSSTTVMNTLVDEVAELTKRFIATRGPQAAWSMLQVMSSPTSLGNKEKMAAAKDFLDRAGFVKTEKVEVKSESPLFILPPKTNEDE
jgi:ClpP class serine protease